MFKIGDRVKCIRVGAHKIVGGIPPPLVLNREYIIYGINMCKCGYLCLDVGIVSLNLMPTTCVCNRLIPEPEVHWCSATRFVKVQETIQYRTVTTEITVKEPVLN